MRQIDSLTAPQLSNPIDAQNMAGFVNQVNDVLKQLSENVLVRVVTSVPTANELSELLDRSEIVILHHATAASRKVWYRKGGVIYSIQGS